MKKIALILLGCGHQDGTEITEAVSAHLALSEYHVHIDFFSFNESYSSVSGDQRNFLKESQRISRQKTQDLTNLNSHNYDALVIPGGSGLLTHLTTWTEEKTKFKVHPLLEKIILEFFKQSKPIGAICIAPLLVGQVLASYHPTITLGEKSEIIPLLKQMNIQHETCPASDYITDRDCKILSTPAYMDEAATAFNVYTGIKLLTKELVEMA